MSRDYRLYLDDILKSIEKIIIYTGSHKSAQQLQDDPVTFEAVAFNLEIIGEAAKNIPELIRNKYPEIEWKSISGMRDKIIHHYHGINSDIIWDVVKNKLPNLATHIAKILSEWEQ